MKDLNKLPVFYQNANIKDINDAVEEVRKKENEKKYISIKFYQTKYHSSNLLYKPVSKIWKLENE